jgi:hypothetical protein
VGRSHPPCRQRFLPASQTGAGRAATAASTEAVAAPAAEVEEVETDAPETDAPEESTAIASNVDNMLAELRPKLVAEIAKKMNSDKEKKDKEKKKKR